MSNARILIEATLFKELLDELARRGQGRRESGAFLLTGKDHPAEILPQPVTAIAFYDDLDPGCLTGAITFHGNGYTTLNTRCRQDGLRVVADIHTHPYQIVRQSRIDAIHPMVARDGHVALIAPRYAIGVTSITELGVHVRDNGIWRSYYGPQVARVVQVRDNLRKAWSLSWRDLLSRLTHHLPRLRHKRNR